MTPDNKARLLKELKRAIEDCDSDPFSSIKTISRVIEEILDYL